MIYPRPVLFKTISEDLYPITKQTGTRIEGFFKYVVQRYIIFIRTSLDFRFSDIPDVLHNRVVIIQLKHEIEHEVELLINNNCSCGFISAAATLVMKKYQPNSKVNATARAVAGVGGQHSSATWEFPRLARETGEVNFDFASDMLYSPPGAIFIFGRPEFFANSQNVVAVSDNQHDSPGEIVWIEEANYFTDSDESDNSDYDV